MLASRLQSTAELCVVPGAKPMISGRHLFKHQRPGLSWSSILLLIIVVTAIYTAIAPSRRHRCQRALD
jgi:hypothetical protein